MGGPSKQSDRSGPLKFKMAPKVCVMQCARGGPDKRSLPGFEQNTSNACSLGPIHRMGRLSSLLALLASPPAPDLQDLLQFGRRWPTTGRNGRTPAASRLSAGTRATRVRETACVSLKGIEFGCVMERSEAYARARESLRNSNADLRSSRSL